MNINSNMTVYKNKSEKKPLIKTDSKNNITETTVTLNLHTGTHIDAPLHMIANGSTLESYPLTKFISKCKVIDLSHLSEKITKDDLININIPIDTFVLFKTKNSFEDDFNFNFIYVDNSAACYLLEKKVIGVGIDALGIERAQENHETHKTLLSNGIIILEGLRLKEIDEGEYTLICLPIRIDNVEASITRAVLINN